MVVCTWNTALLLFDFMGTHEGTREEGGAADIVIMEDYWSSAYFQY